MRINPIMLVWIAGVLYGCTTANLRWRKTQSKLCATKVAFMSYIAKIVTNKIRGDTIEKAWNKKASTNFIMHVSNVVKVLFRLMFIWLYLDQ